MSSLAYICDSMNRYSLADSSPGPQLISITNASMNCGRKKGLFSCYTLGQQIPLLLGRSMLQKFVVVHRTREHRIILFDSQALLFFA